MKAFVDASVLVAIMASEPDKRYWLEQLHSTPSKVTSPVAIWETVRASARIVGAPIAAISDRLSVLLDGLCIEIMQIGHVEAKAALLAHEQYGRGRHAAQLNMGDCFAYACAKAHGSLLFYKGDDFAQTDLA